jgi:hypothetical protein
MGDEAVEILNAKCVFGRDAPQPIRNRFGGGIAQKTLLKQGEMLFRFVEARFSGAPDDFWLPLETYHRFFHIKSVPAWAIWKNANSRAQVPATFWRATLTRSVYGFKGLAALAEKQAITWENLISGGLLWVPGLSDQDFHLRVYRIMVFP